MTAQANNTNEVKTVMTLATKVANSWKEGSPERLVKFFANQVKSLESQIKTCRANNAQLKTAYDLQVDELDLKIEDLTDDVESAYKAIKPEDISSNEKAKEFARSYWSSINNAKFELDEAIAKKVTAKEAYEASRKAVNAQIKLREQDIATIKGEDKK